MAGEQYIVKKIVLEAALNKFSYFLFIFFYLQAESFECNTI